MKNLIKISIFFIIIINVNKLSSEETDSLQIKRQAYFMNQRIFPFDSIPYHLYFEAVEDKFAKQTSKGFSLPLGNNWYLIGPNQLNGDYSGDGGKALFVKYDPTCTTRIYLGAPSGGIWRSDDGGLTWLPKADFLQSINSGALAIDDQTGKLYYGTGDPTWIENAYPGNGIYVSTDHGDTWSKLTGNNLPQHTRFDRIVIDPSHHNVLYAAEQTGLYKSIDAGENWTKLLPLDQSDKICSDVAVSTDGQSIYAVGPGNYFIEECYGIGYYQNTVGYWKSTNGGLNFTFKAKLICNFPNFTDILPNARTFIAIAKPEGSTEESIIYILTFNDSSVYLGGNSYIIKPYFVFKSTNSGENFERLHGSSYGNAIEYTGANAGYNNFLYVNPHNSNNVYVGLLGLYKTTDGYNFLGAGGTNLYADKHGMDINPQNFTEMIETDDGGLHRSTDGGVNWQKVNSTLSLFEFYKIGSDAYNKNIVSGGAQDHGLCIKQSENGWYMYGGCDGGNVSYSPITPGAGIANMGNCNDDVFYAIVNEWGIINPNTYFGTSFWTAAMAGHPTELSTFFMMRYYNGSFYLFKSTNNGQYYDGNRIEHTSYSNFSNTFTQFRIPTNLAISSKNPNIIYCVGGSNNYPNTIFRSEDAGHNWSYLTSGGIGNLPNRFFTHLEIDPADPNILLLSASGYESGHVFRSYDGGYNWTNINGDLKDNPVNDVIIYYEDCNTKYYVAATDVGVWRCNASDPSSWTELAPGLPNSTAIDLDYNRLSQTLRTSLFGRSVWEVQLVKQDQTTLPIIVKDNLIIAANCSLNRDIIVCAGGKLSLPAQCSIDFVANKKIIDMDGGEIAANTGAQITLTCNSGNWGGIEFQGSGSGDLKHCIFQNTETPIIINPYNGLNEPPVININNCILSNKININTRNNVNILNCSWTYFNNSCITALYSDNLSIENNNINPSLNFINTSAISISSGDNIYLSKNKIYNFNPCISFSNSNVNVTQNELIINVSNYISTGIIMDYCYS
jgi:photosystem II stability/assembly factor-like uncharacterized protein